MTTIILPISRTEYLRAVFTCLANLEKPSDTELIIITDGGKELQTAVDRRLDSISFKRIQVINFGETPAEDINSRRYRISAIHNKAKHYVPEESDYVFCIEDDSFYPPDTLAKLTGTINHMDGCAFVEGVQLGRHNSPYVGAWTVDNIQYPSEVKSILPSGEIITSIDAGGLYCAIMDAQLYRLHNFEPLDKQGINGLSCDVNFGLNLRRLGYTCLLDWRVVVDHIGEKGSVNIGNTKPVQVIATKTDKWNWRTVIEVSEAA